MIASFGVYGLSLLAGVLSILSPCVLPLVPILVGTALNTHRYGPYCWRAFKIDQVCALNFDQANLGCRLLHRCG